MKEYIEPKRVLTEEEYQNYLKKKQHSKDIVKKIENNKLDKHIFENFNYIRNRKLTEGEKGYDYKHNRY